MEELAGEGRKFYALPNTIVLVRPKSRKFSGRGKGLSGEGAQNGKLVYISEKLEQINQLRGVVLYAKIIFKKF